jgi:hypothetical protein
MAERSFEGRKTQRVMASTATPEGTEPFGPLRKRVEWLQLPYAAYAAGSTA